MDTTFRPSLLSDSGRARWRSPTFALMLHAGAAGAFALASLTAPGIVEEPSIVVELVPVAAPPAAIEPTPPMAVSEPPPPLAKALPKPTPAPTPKLAVKAAAPVPSESAPSPQPPSPTPEATSEAGSDVPVAASSAATGPSGAATHRASEDMAYVPPSSTAAYLSNPKPHYPPMARRKGWEGVVRLTVQVAEDGRPVSVTVAQSSGYSLLDQCAQAAVQQWRFSPARRGGQQVAASVEVPIRFGLSDG